GYGTWKPQDPRHLFGPAACFFQNPDWMRGTDRSVAWESEWWGFDPSRLVPGPDAAPRAMQHFADAGLTVIRGDGDYLLVTNGIVGTGGFGNHKHNDLLGFE